MNKKEITKIIVVTLSIFVFILLIFNNALFNKLLINAGELKQISINNNRWNDIIETRQKTDEQLIQSIKFNDYDLVYDKKGNRWFYSLIENSSNRYNPNVKYKTSKENVKIAFKNIEITDELIEKNQNIEFIAYTDNEYNMYSLVCTTLPIISITDIENETIMKEEPIFKNSMSPKEETVDMNMFLFDNRSNATQRVIETQGNIHIRGGTSERYPKKGYKISLIQKSVGNHNRNNNISLLGMRNDDDWILYAGYNDQEKIRNVFASNLWYYSCADNNSFGIKNGMEYKYVELFFNNEYWGLYAIGFPIDEKQLELSKDSQGEYNEYLFKKIVWAVPWGENNMVDIDKEVGFDLKSKTKNEEVAWEKLKSIYITMRTSKDIEELYSIVDVNNAIDIYLFYNFIQGNDNVRGYDLKNTYLTIKDGKALYTPWDFDFTLGNDLSKIDKAYTSPYIVSVDTETVMYYSIIKYLNKLGDTNINLLLKERYARLRETTWSNTELLKLLEKYEDDIYNSGAFLRDKERWPDGLYNDESIKLEEFKSFLNKRLEFMDKYVENL